MSFPAADHHHVQALSRIHDCALSVKSVNLSSGISGLVTKDWPGIDAAICVPWKSCATARPRKADLGPVWSINANTRSAGGPVT